MKKQFTFFLIGFTLLLSVSFFLTQPKNCAFYVLEAFSMWATNVLPFLFPFFVFSKLLTELGILYPFGKTFYPLCKFLHIPTSAGQVFLVSLMSGYPIGVKTTCELTQKGIYNISQCERISSLCNFVGPVFAIGSVGAFFNDHLIGLIIFLSGVIGAIINELFYLPRQKNSELSYNNINKNLFQKNHSNIFYNCVFSSIQSILFVGGCIAIFFLLGKMIIYALPSNTPPILSAIIMGSLEMTSGVKMVASFGNGFFSIMLACAFVSFGGLCIFLQCYAYWSTLKIKAWKMLIKKTTQAIVSCCICALLYFVFGLYK